MTGGLYVKAERLPGVYKITNTVSNKVYIGSSINVHERITHHRNSLLKGRHSNKHLQRSFNVHGIDSFTVEVVSYYSTVDDALIEEQRMLDSMFSAGIGTYNISRSVSASMLGLSHSNETRAKQSRIAKGRVFSLEHIKNMRLAAKSRKTPILTKQHRDKISSALVGNKNGAGNKGKVRTKDTLKLLSVIRKGRVPWNKGLSMDSSKMLWFTDGTHNTRSSHQPPGYRPGRSHKGKWNNQFRKTGKGGEP